MSNKQANKKLIRQNMRNRLVNRRYSSAMKALLKLLKKKMRAIMSEKNADLKKILKNDAQKIECKFYSIVDKSIKKGVLHKNNGARKKSKLSRMVSTL